MSTTAGWFLLGISVCATAWAGRIPPTPPAPAPEAVISVIIDDLGDDLPRGLEAVRLPGPVACAILPHTPYARELAERAHRRNKAVLLHLPMEAMVAHPLGPGALTGAMSRERFLDTVHDDLASVPYVEGVNNHMGSRLTRDPVRMAWLMEALHRHGHLYFVDSRTTRATVARQAALDAGVAAVARKVFLDDRRDPAAIRRQFARLIEIARRDGSALAIGHPYPETLSVLAELLPGLAARRVRLIPVSRLIDLNAREVPTWHASLSR